MLHDRSWLEVAGLLLHALEAGAGRAWLWPLTAVLAVGLYPGVRWFAALKQRRRDIAWLKYL